MREAGAARAPKGVKTGLQESGAVGRQALRMPHRIGGQGIGHQREAIGRQRMWDNQDAVVRTPQELSHRGAEVLVEVELHDSWTINEGC